MTRKKRIKFPLTQRSLRVTLLTVLMTLFSYFYYTSVEAFVHVRMPKSDSPAELYSNQTQDDLRQMISTAISQAENSVTMVVYSLTDSKVIQALKDKAEQGKDVFVVVDAVATPSNVNKRLGDRVKVLRRNGKGLMHQKILVIDEKNVWVGSANMTTDSLKTNCNLVTGIQSEPLGEWLVTKARSYTAVDRSSLFPVRKFQLADQTLEFWFLPDNPNAIHRLLSLIHNAQKSIRVGMFTWTRIDFVEALIDAKMRGVDVEVVMDSDAGKGANAQVVEKLLKGNIPLSFNRANCLLHYKMMEVDERILVNGSANWTKAAFSKNDDCFMILYDLTEEQKKFMDKLWKTMLLDSDLQSTLYTERDTIIASRSVYNPQTLIAI